MQIFSQPVQSENSTGTARRRAHEEYDGLESLRATMQKKLSQLREDLAIETNSAACFQLQQQIQSEVKELDRLDGHLYDLEQQPEPLMQTDQIMLFLDLSLRQAKIQNPQLLDGIVLDDSIQFGLKEGRLNMKLQDAVMLRADIELGRYPLDAINPVISCGGSAEKPYWIFKPELKEILDGDIPQTELGKLQLNRLPCQVKITFEFNQKDIEFLGLHKLLFTKINCNSYKAVKISLYQNYIESKVDPYVSCAEAVYE